MQNTTIAIPQSHCRASMSGVPVSTLRVLFDRAVAAAPDDGTVMLPYPIWREAFINDADEALAKSSYDSQPLFVGGRATQSVGRRDRDTKLSV